MVMRTPIVLSVLFILTHLHLYGHTAREALLILGLEVIGAAALVLVGLSVFTAGVRHGVHGVKPLGAGEALEASGE